MDVENGKSLAVFELHFDFQTCVKVRLRIGAAKRMNINHVKSLSVFEFDFSPFRLVSPSACEMELLNEWTQLVS